MVFLNNNNSICINENEKMKTYTTQKTFSFFLYKIFIFQLSDYLSGLLSAENSFSFCENDGYVASSKFE